MPGSRFAPSHVRIASQNVESYSPLQRQDLKYVKIHDAGDLAFEDATWEAVSKHIKDEAAKMLSVGKFPVFLGGEHGITPPLVSAVHAFFPDLVVVQLDAHADLRSKFLNEPYSHATAMYQSAGIVGKSNVFQYGIRSGTQEEIEQASHLYLFAVLDHLRKSKSMFQGRPVYLTIDLDVLDPGTMPAVATPEPGGISYQELIASLVELRDCRIVGADVVEYNPLANRDPAPASLVASLLREIVLATNPKRI